MLSALVSVKRCAQHVHVGSCSTGVFDGVRSKATAWCRHGAAIEASHEQECTTLCRRATEHRQNLSIAAPLLVTFRLLMGHESSPRDKHTTEAGNEQEYTPLCQTTTRCQQHLRVATPLLVTLHLLMGYESRLQAYELNAVWQASQHPQATQLPRQSHMIKLPRHRSDKQGNGTAN